MPATREVGRFSAADAGLGTRPARIPMADIVASRGKPSRGTRHRRPKIPAGSAAALCGDRCRPTAVVGWTWRT